MKRSKMIDIIYDFLIDRDYPSYRDSDDLLKIIEKVGMRPPKDPITLLSEWEEEDVRTKKN